MSVERTPVAAFISQTEIGSAKFAVEVVVCADGTVWRRLAGNTDWVEDAPIPGSPVIHAREIAKNWGGERT